MPLHALSARMAYIVFVALVLSALVVQRRGAEAAFLWVWLPFFLAMPTVFWVNIPGLPDPNFAQAAILPLLLVIARDRLPQLRAGPMEVLLLLYVAVRVFCDFLSRGYADAQNYGFYMLTSVIGPYLLGRCLITRREMDVATARMVVMMFVLFFPLFIYEAKFWVSPIYQLLSPMFPNAFSGLSIRWGLARTAGTFEHPILACIMIIAAYRLYRWLAWTGEWTRPQPGLMGRLQALSRRLPGSLSLHIGAVLVLMALMTISRGPWIGGIAAAVLVAAGNARQRGRALILVGLLFVLGGLGGKLALDAYITPAEGEVLSGEAQTMLYRKEMVERYKAFLFDRVWQGWGLTDVPKIPGMESVDNAFFLMALQHGVVAVAVFAVMFLYAIGSQLRFGLRTPPGSVPIGFTFSGIYLMCFIAFTTVYMGAQTEPLLFLLLGWGESIKRRPPGDDLPQGAAPPKDAGAKPPFARVLR